MRQTHHCLTKCEIAHPQASQQGRKATPVPEDNHVKHTIRDLVSAVLGAGVPTASGCLRAVFPASEPPPPHTPTVNAPPPHDSAPPAPPPPPPRQSPPPHTHPSSRPKQKCHKRTSLTPEQMLQSTRDVVSSRQPTNRRGRVPCVGACTPRRRLWRTPMGSRATVVVQCWSGGVLAEKKPSARQAH